MYIVFTIIVWFSLSSNIIYSATEERSLYLIRSQVDNISYSVLDIDNKYEAADLLARVRRTLDTLCTHLNRGFKNDNRVLRLISRYRSGNIKENWRSNLTSYSINKGEFIVLCIRTSQYGQHLEDENTVRYIAIHELAHVMSLSEGHTEEFWTNFRFLLAHAVKNKLYKEVDYRRHPVRYCGTKLTDSPLRLSRERTMKTYL